MQINGFVNVQSTMMQKLLKSMTNNVNQRYIQHLDSRLTLTMFNRIYAIKYES